jgi:hypothetical protein
MAIKPERWWIYWRAITAFGEKVYLLRRADNTLVKKNWLEIGLSTGLVFLMIVLILGAQMALPAELRSSSFALIVLLFMVAMGLVGLKLVDL